MTKAASHGYTLKTLKAIAQVGDFIQEFVDVPKFLAYCKECENYGQRWSCPPFRFDPMKLWGRFQRLWLFGRVLTPNPDTELSTLLAGLEQEKSIMLDELLNLEQEHPGSLALSAGSCDLCKGECPRPQGEPCVHMGRMRWSIEALGGDVAKTAEQYFNLPMLWIKDGQVPDYLMLVGGLLIREASR